MSVRTILSLLFALGMAGLLAAETPKPVSDDVQDFVFFADGRPLLIRAHVRVGDRSYRAVWDDYVAKVFKYLDTDGDGVLSQKEIDRMPPMQFITGNGLFGGRRPGVRNEVLTPHKDGKATRDELATFLEKNGAAPFQFQMGQSTAGVYGAKVITLGASEPVSAEALSNAIFNLLDKNKDGKLSRDELAAAPAVFAALDANDDEMITPKEILPNAGSGNVYGFKQDAAAVVVSRNSPTVSTENAPVMLINPGESGAALARQLLARYGPKGDKKKKLSAADLGMDQASFDKLDADKDGLLDAEELAQFAKRVPDVELNIKIPVKAVEPAQSAKPAKPDKPRNLYAVPEEGTSGEVDGTARAGGAIDVKLTKTSGGIDIDLGVTHLELRAGALASNSNLKLNFKLRDQYVNFFKQADTDNNGYLDEKEAMASPIFRDVFKALDTDGDGMLYEKEMIAALDKVEELQKAVQTGCVTLALSDKGNGLFDLLDKDHDGRLSVRELRGAVDLIKMLDRDGDGLFARNELPHKFEMRVRQGPAGSGNDNGNVVVVARSFSLSTQPAADKGVGPVWFRKMDTNRDGDVSRREFLGTDDEFRQIDTDGDGLISAKEAEEADKRFRKAAANK